MDKSRLQEILAREHKKLEEGGAQWLREYGKGKRDNAFTFYMICRTLAALEDSSLRSLDLQKLIKSFLEERSVPFSDKDWKPVLWFLADWTEEENNARTGAKNDAPLNGPNFIDDFSKIIKREKSTPQRMWLAELYTADVRDFFGKNAGGRTSRVEEKAMSEPSELAALGRRLFWEPAGEMEKVAQLSRDKGQIIFYGPPGTGKTYVARALAKYLIGEERPEDFSRFLQFHPSYSYEDFFEGYRPVPDNNGGVPQFRLIPGPLKELAEHAKRPENSEKWHVLVIDEINRGNLAKIFGELYFLLEYRDEAIRLQYGGELFSLPKNLLIIGTMNTADRSISHIDAALRRRFHFFPLFPDQPPILGLLRRYLKSNHPAMEWVAGVVDGANQQLQVDGRDGLIGHSYFMRDDLDETWVERIWEYSILPLIEDRFIDQPDRIKEFQLNTLRSGLREAPPREAA
jgi:hypothetical protein